MKLRTLTNTDCYAGRCGKGIARYNGTVWYTEGYNLQGPSGNITQMSAYGSAAGTDSSNAIFSGMFFVTTAPAAILEFSPIIIGLFDFP